MKTIIIDGVEYNLTPKVAFHEGDWLIHKNIVNEPCCITHINEPHYYLTNLGSFIKFGEEDDYRPWTIQDAKAGDVLKEDSCIFILKELKDNDTAIVGCVLYDDGDFDTGLTLHFDSESTQPATKEQRDQLEKAMTDAGYTFDFEKKELKKIEQKPAEWSEENESYIRYLIECLEVCVKGTAIKMTPSTAQKYINWLKSLRPQNTWKPSEEQIKAVRLARAFVVDDFDEHPALSEILIELEEQLKKLK